MSNAHFYLQLIAENSTTKNQFNNYPIYTCYIRINWKAIIFIP